MVLTDRFTKGFLTGLVGGAVSLSWGLFSKYVLHFTDILFGEFAAILIYGKPAVSLGEHLFAQVALFGFYGLCGTIFVFFIPYISSKNLYLKGCFWGGFIWFSSHAVTILFRVPELTILDLYTSISHFIGALLWGFFMVLALDYLTKRVK